MQIFLTILGVLSAVGGGMTALAVRLNPLERWNKWLKYAVYLLFVFGLFFWLDMPRTSRMIAFGGVSLIGLIEFIRAIRLKASVREYLWPIAVYIFLLVGFVRAAGLSPQILGPVLMAVIVFDSFSQLTGQLVGRSKLIPSISPGKTTEGFIGGWIAVLVVAIFEYMNHLSIATGLATELVLSSVLAVLAFVGDILASVIKRKLGLKDYSHWIPGHGGVNDRFDSLIFTLAIVAYATLLTQ
ncbi:MAG: phosphatidate cytidylyltransferase [Bacteroidetes bacterium]|nr:MAG: phosphatidate cytidylyltransferase [Bacteroidota bacterium]